MPAARVPARPALRAPRRPRLHRRRHHLDHRAAHLVHLPVLPVHHAAAGGGGGARQGAAPCHDVVHLQDTLLISSRVPLSPCTLSWCCTIFLFFDWLISVPCSDDSCSGLFPLPSDRAL